MTVIAFTVVFRECYIVSVCRNVHIVYVFLRQFCIHYLCMRM